LPQVDEALEVIARREIMVALVAIAPGNAQWKKDLAWFDGQIARIEGQAQPGGR
jgi:hypothetical protein